ncbi:hypothetical protein [Atribacter laminatus]|uniref:hypothetical protein n=1 Tax=Atribacter laminatus TaxID=2847778 RepID=UPI001C405B43|nr:hypothetical protein [Atribacter laminatus]
MVFLFPGFTILNFYFIDNSQLTSHYIYRIDSHAAFATTYKYEYTYKNRHCEKPNSSLVGRRGNLIHHLRYSEDSGFFCRTT